MTYFPSNWRRNLLQDGQREFMYYMELLMLLFESDGTSINQPDPTDVDRYQVKKEFRIEFEQ